MLHPKTWKITTFGDGGRDEVRTGATHEEAVLAILGAMHGEPFSELVVSETAVHEHPLAA